MTLSGTRSIRRVLNTRLLNLNREAESQEQVAVPVNELNLGERIATVRQATILIEQSRPLDETGVLPPDRFEEFVTRGFFLMTIDDSAVFVHMLHGQWLSVEVTPSRTLIFRRLGERLNDPEDDAWPGPAWKLVLDELRRGLPAPKADQPTADVIPAAGPRPAASETLSPPFLLTDGPLLPVFERRLISVLKRAIAAAANQIRSSSSLEHQQRHDDLYQLYEHLSRPDRRWPLPDSDADRREAHWVQLCRSGFTLVHTSGVLDFSNTPSGWILRTWDYQKFAGVLRQHLGPDISDMLNSLKDVGTRLHFLTRSHQDVPEVRLEEEPDLSPDEPASRTGPNNQTLQEKVRDRLVRPSKVTSPAPAPDPDLAGPALPRISWVTALKRAIREQQEQLAALPSVEVQETLEALQRVHRGCLDLKRQVHLLGPSAPQRSGRVRPVPPPTGGPDGFAVMGQRGCLLLRHVEGHWHVDDWDSGRPAKVRLRRPDARWQDPADPEWPSKVVRQLLEDLALPGTVTGPETDVSPPAPVEDTPGRAQWNGLLKATITQMQGLMDDAQDGPWLTEMRRIFSGLDVISRALDHAERELPLAPVDAVARVHWNLLVRPRLEQPFFMTTNHGVCVCQPTPDGYAAWSWDVRQPTQVNARSFDLLINDPLDPSWPPPDLAPLLEDLRPLLAPLTAADRPAVLMAFMGGGFRLFRTVQESLRDSGGSPVPGTHLQGDDGLTQLYRQLRSGSLIWQVPTGLEAGSVQRRLDPHVVRLDVLVRLLGFDIRFPALHRASELASRVASGKVALQGALDQAAPWQRHLLRAVEGVRWDEDCLTDFLARTDELAAYLHVEEVRAVAQGDLLQDRLALLAALTWLTALDEEGAVSRSTYTALCAGVHDMIRRVSRPAGTTEEQISRRVRSQFGLEARSPQLQAISQVVGAAGVHLVVLPTGSGKTLVTWTAAQLLGDLDGQTVVIAPLQALIQDQIREARQHRLAADGLTGRLDPGERQDRLEGFRNGDTRILYLTPEQLGRQDIQQALQSRPPDLWVFDEAHTLTQWGGAFRPSYLRAVQTVADLGGAHPRVLLTTATLTYEEIQALQTLFRAFGPLRVAVHEFVLPDRLRIEVRTSDDEHVRLSLLVEALTATRSARHQALIYCSTPLRAEELQLRLAGYFPGQVAAYHGSLDAEQRQQREQDFLSERFAFLVATSAFGLGMNNPNVRLVVHADPPASIEDYVQQVGRATRMDYDAGSLIICDPADLERQFRLLSAQLLQREDYRRIFAGIREFALAAGDGASLWMTPLEVALMANVGSDRATSHQKGDLALNRLERLGVLTLEPTRPVALALTDTQEEAAEDAVERLSPGGQVLWTYLQTPGCVAETVADLVVATRQSAEQVLGHLVELQEQRLLQFDYQLSVFFNKGTRIAGLRASVQRLFSVQRGLSELLRSQTPASVGTWKFWTEQVLQQFKEAQPDLQVTGTDLQLALSFWESMAGCTFSFSPGAREFTLTLRAGQNEDLLDHLDRRANTFMMAATKLVELLYAQTRSSGRAVRAPFSYQAAHTASGRTVAVGHLLNVLHRLRLITLGSGSDLRAVAHGIRYQPNHGRTLNTLDYAEFESDNARRFARVHLVEQLLACTSENGVRALIQDYFEQPLEVLYRTRFGQTISEAPSCRHADLQRIQDLSPAQKRIVASRERTLLVVAGPGSGKTRTIVHRIAHLLRVERVAPQRILVVAFNRAASREVRKRLFDLVGADAVYVDVLTFHALALRILNINLAELAVQSGRNKGDVLKTALAEALTRLTGDQQEDGEEQARLENFVGRYDYVLIDEYQDIDEEQYGLVKLLVGHGRGEDRERTRYNLWAVGDDDQTLYQFRGAKPKFLQQFEEEYATKRQVLSSNYRSGPAIVAVSNALISRSSNRAKIRDDEQVRAVRADLHGPSVFYHQRSGPDARAFVAREIQHLLQHDSTLRPGDIAVLAPRWASLVSTWATLRELGIGARLLRSGSPLAPLLSWNVQQALTALDSRAGGMRSNYSLRQDLKDALAREQLGEHAPGLQRALHAAQQIDDERRETKLFSAAVLARTMITDLRERLAEPNAAEAGRDEVTCSTFHSAKGLEFRVVFVIAERPRSKRGKDPQEQKDAWEEQLRAYYVGITRAKDQLYLVDTPGTACDFMPQPTSAGVHVLSSSRGVGALPEIGTVELTYDQYGDMNLGHSGTITKRVQELLRTSILQAPEPCSLNVLRTPRGSIAEFSNGGGRVGALSVATTDKLFKLFPQRHWLGHQVRVLEGSTFHPESSDAYLVPIADLSIRTRLG